MLLIKTQLMILNDSSFAKTAFCTKLEQFGRERLFDKVYQL